MSLAYLSAGDKSCREVRTEWGGINLNGNATDRSYRKSEKDYGGQYDWPSGVVLTEEQTNEANALKADLETYFAPRTTCPS